MYLKKEQARYSHLDPWAHTNLPEEYLDPFLDLPWLGYLES